MIFKQSLAAGERVRVDHPTSICDGLLSYDVGDHNWPILKEKVHSCLSVPDLKTRGSDEMALRQSWVANRAFGSHRDSGVTERRSRPFW